ncbi:hypothetical protein J2Z35_002490 [Acetoanaerobium pronyense]|uniref:Nucleotidyl transferase AbiEii toxin, Type IV TA system n=1 Tax=Acetoanaerobium pronyense TaxID=1482736 RepID=A0ABS4KLJ9_9FIRM|nr:nucleotidyltransferase family protein [Acetoanaerobium pronyense]MBP2028660.1 hypothetical protein [Acetoanaerobium pronyense]
MENVLLKLGKELNKNDIKWGIGGSLLLKKHLLIDSANDIDIIVSAKDINKAVDILDKLAIRMPVPIKKEYSTKHFFQYKLDGVSIDVMSQFTINHECGSFEFIFDEKSTPDSVKIGDIELPYTSLEDWLIAYMLMVGRENKVKLIWDYFINNGISYPELIERALKLQIPESIKNRLLELLNYEKANLL